MYEVYVTKNTITGKYYVGQTSRGIVRRWQHHIACFKRGIDTYLYRSFSKYGVEAFIFPIVVASAHSKKEINELEKSWIYGLNSNNTDFGYNLTSGGEGCSGYKHTDEFKKSVSERNKSRIWSEESREKLSKSVSEISKGKKLSKEHKVKIGLANSKRVLSEETKRKIGNASRIRQSSPEAKKAFIERMKRANG